MDQQQFSTITAIGNEVQNLTQAIAILAEGRINAMTVHSAEGAEPAQVTTASTANIDFPADMIDQIVALLQAELDRLNGQLHELGVG